MIGTLLSICLAAATMWPYLSQESTSSQQQTPTFSRPIPATGYIHEMRYLDTDGDRKIDAKELAAGQHMASMLLMLSWDECDRDGDGTVSLVEFQVAAHDAMQALREADSEAARQAEDALAQAITMRLLLEQLARDEQYAAEIAALRAEIEDLDDDEVVVTYLIKYPTRYPRLTPIVRTWVRHYPVKPKLYRLVKPYGPRLYRPPARTKVIHPPKARPKVGKAPAKRPSRPVKKARPRRP